MRAQSGDRVAVGDGPGFRACPDFACRAFPPPTWFIASARIPLVKRTSERPDHTTADSSPSGRRQAVHPTPLWYKIIMFGLMLLGLAWVVVFYISGSAMLPVPAIGNWNILVGFGLIMIGFMMTVGWH